MKRISVLLVLAFAFAAFAAEPATTVQVTHLSASEVGFRCTAGGKLATRQVADMTILTCKK